MLLFSKLSKISKILGIYRLLGGVRGGGRSLYTPPNIAAFVVELLQNAAIFKVF